MIFDILFSKKAEIEKEIGSPLEWERNEGKRNWKIRKTFDDGARDKEETWPILREKMVDAMSKFVTVFRPRLEKINKTED